MNVACGGSLYQDIPAQVTQALQHRQIPPATRCPTVSRQSGQPAQRIIERSRMQCEQFASPIGESGRTSPHRQRDGPRWNRRSD